MNDPNIDLKKLPFSNIVNKIVTATKKNNVDIYLTKEIERDIEEGRLSRIKKLSDIITYLRSLGLSKKVSTCIVLDAVEIAAAIRNI